jgi:8-oxo-dGTP pyrophosphatase MutT (NUDIX family)
MASNRLGRQLAELTAVVGLAAGESSPEQGSRYAPAPMSDLATRAVRDHVLAAVRARTPVDDRERLSIERFLAEIEPLADPFSELAPVHVTTSAIVVGSRGVLLHRHRVLGVWVAPGGHIDPGETPWEAVVREAKEETGVAVTHHDGEPRLIHVDVHAGPYGHTHLDLRYLLDGEADPAPPPDESQEVVWFSFDEALTIVEPCMVGILRSLASAVS